MCGIAGQFLFDRPLRNDDVARVGRMLDTMPWRGPDARGVVSRGKCVLGHLRLSIVDLSSDANQPMTDAFGRTIVFNGEIYNYRELRKSLQNRYAFRTNSDTEVILAAYDAWGAECVHQFNGDWAFAIHDSQTDGLFLSRDRFGIKPLYWHQGRGFLLFASEVRALLAGGVPGVVSPLRLAEFLRFRQNELRDTTLIEGIQPLTPGTNLFVKRKGAVKNVEYYGPQQLFGAAAPDNQDQAADAFGELFTDAVTLRLHADVPVGICLSGGMDSSAITAVAARLHGDRPRTYSANFPGDPADESRFSALVAKSYGTIHHTVCPTLNDFFEKCERFLLAQDTPHAGPRALARLMVLEAAAEDVTVLLDGQGGDEIFGGYEATYRIYRKEYERPIGKRLLMMTPPKARKASQIEPLAELAPALREYVGQLKKPYERLHPPRDAYSDRQFHILRNNLLSLLHTEDRMTMINSLEGRVPLLDHRLVEFCFSLPVHFKMQEYDKHLMRYWLDREKILPTEITRRTDKKGFSTSFDTLLAKDPRAQIWFRDQIRGLFEDVPGIFCSRAVTTLLDEQRTDGVDNVKRLLAAISVLTYFHRHRLTLGDLSAWFKTG